MRVCAEPGCPTITTSSRCPAHTRARDRQRGSRQARGYDAGHDRERSRWAPLVAAGAVDCRAAACLEPRRRIAPDAAWDLGHTADRRHWTGPEHARCNRAAGGRSAHGLA